MSTAAVTSRAYVQIERSIMSHNTGDGFSASTAGSGAIALVMLSRNAMNRNLGAGASVTGTVAGTVTAHFSENAISANNAGAIHADGALAEVEASANAFAANAPSDMYSTASATLISFGNNSGDAHATQSLF